MGVDNNAILFLGREESDIDFSKLPDFDLEEYDDCNGHLGEWSVAHGYSKSVWDSDALQTRLYSEYNPVLVGFELGNSGSYGCRAFAIDLVGLIQAKTKVFKEVFGVEPKIFILNWQS
jgi:hypothetical protein